MGLWDCSALFAWYWYLQWKWEFKTVQNSMSSAKIFNMGIVKYIQEWLNRWDIMFFRNLDGWVNHIAMVVSYRESETWYVIEIIDLSTRYNVSRREINVYKDEWKIMYEAEWEKYIISFSTNVLFDRVFKKQKMATINWVDFNVYYNPNNKPTEFTATITTYITPVNQGPTTLIVEVAVVQIQQMAQYLMMIWLERSQHVLCNIHIEPN